MNVRPLRRLVRAAQWLECALLVACFGLALRYGFLAGSYPLAFGVSWWLTRREALWARRVLALLVAGLAVVVAASGLTSFFGPRLDNATIAFVAMHAMVGAHLVLMVLPPLIQHVRRGRASEGRARWSGQAALLVARLSFWPAIIAGTIAIGPLWLRDWHLWFLAPALLAMAAHGLVPRLRRLGSEGALAPALGVALGAATFVGAYWLNARYWWKPTPQATYTAMPRLETAPALATTEGGHTVPVSMIGESARCADEACHPRVSGQWERSAHRRSANVFYRRAVEVAVERHGWQAVRLCASCHDPVALLSGYYATRPESLFGPSADHEGVSCLACHRASVTPEHVGTGSYRYDPPRFFVGPPMEGYSAHAMRPEHIQDMFGAERYVDSALCGECHSLTLHGPDGLALLEQDTYGEWRSGPYGEAARARADGSMRPCVACHMPKVEDPDRPGPREATHRFLGASTHLAALAGDGDQLAALQGFLRGADVEIAIGSAVSRAGADGGTVLELPVTVRNGGVGHGFPSGALDLNEVWVEVEVRDARGREVWRSGTMGTDGAVPADAVFLRRVLADPGGRAILDHDILSTAGHLEDRTVPPGGELKLEFDVPLPPGAAPPFEATARVNHRGVNRHFARLALGDAAPSLPLTVVAERSAALAVQTALRPP